VIGHHHEGVELDAEEVLGAAEHTQDQVVDVSGRPQEEAAVNGAGGDLDEGTGRNETQGTRHTCLSAADGRVCLLEGDQQLEGRRTWMVARVCCRSAVIAGEERIDDLDDSATLFLWQRTELTKFPP
jgi:hypothetical protein